MKFLNLAYPVRKDFVCLDFRKFEKIKIPKEQLSSLKGGDDSIGIVDLVDG